MSRQLVVELPEATTCPTASPSTTKARSTSPATARIASIGWPVDGDLEVVADDPLGLKLNTPTNVAFVGPGLDRLAIANVGEWHILVGDVGARGAPLFYPTVG